MADQPTSHDIDAVRELWANDGTGAGGTLRDDKRIMAVIEAARALLHTSRNDKLEQFFAVRRVREAVEALDSEDA